MHSGRDRSFVAGAGADDRWIVFEGGEGPGKGKHVVLVAATTNTAARKALPQLAKILATHHGFKCTVLFSQDEDGTINPDAEKNIPGLEALKTADLMVLGLRFRDLPDEQMQHFADYVAAGKPIVALRTSTHAFNTSGNKKHADWNWTKNGGFGKKVLGETWVAHHGGHGSESTRGLIAPGAEEHPIVRGIKNGDMWGPTDVYTVKLPLADCKPILLGQVLKGMKFDDPPVEGKKNDPMMPIVWTKTYEGEGRQAGTRGDEHAWRGHRFHRRRLAAHVRERRLLVSAAWKTRFPRKERRSIWWANTTPPSSASAAVSKERNRRITSRPAQVSHADVECALHVTHLGQYGEHGSPRMPVFRRPTCWWR